MSVTAYKTGYKHGLNNKPFLRHRKGKAYDSRKNMRSYRNGYADGAKERHDIQKQIEQSIEHGVA